MQRMLCAILIIIVLTGCGYDENIHEPTTEYLKENLTTGLINENSFVDIRYGEPMDKEDSEFGKVHRYNVYIDLETSISDWTICDQWTEIVHVTNLLEGKVIGQGTRFEGIYDNVYVDFSKEDYNDEARDIDMNVYGVAKMNTVYDYDSWHISHYDDNGDPVYISCMFNQRY
jgi:hypothetical protein